MQIGQIIRSYTVEPIVDPVAEPRPEPVREAPEPVAVPELDPLPVRSGLVPRDAG